MSNIKEKNIWELKKHINRTDRKSNTTSDNNNNKKRERERETTET